jgi:LacI family transcriptional regulator
VTAIGVLHKAYSTGLRVPDGLSIIGFDNIHISGMMTPPLTTIQMSCFELAKAAVTALRAYVEKTPTKRDYPIPTQLVVRKSTGYPRGSMLDLRRTTKRSS